MRKVLAVVIGFPLLLIGLVMIPLPGPGLPIVVAGLFVLSLEFEWARRHLAYTRSKLDSATRRMQKGGSRIGRSLRARWRGWTAGCRQGR